MCPFFFEKMLFEADEKISGRIEESIILYHDIMMNWVILLGDNHSGDSTFFLAFFLKKTVHDFLVFFLHHYIDQIRCLWQNYFFKNFIFYGLRRDCWYFIIQPFYTHKIFGFN